jgi:hypothetical protein
LASGKKFEVRGFGRKIEDTRRVTKTGDEENKKISKVYRLKKKINMKSGI